MVVIIQSEMIMISVMIMMKIMVTIRMTIRMIILMFMMMPMMFHRGDGDGLQQRAFTGPTDCHM